MSDIIKINQFP